MILFSEGTTFNNFPSETEGFYQQKFTIRITNARRLEKAVAT
jgi:hypothetical protein